MGRCPWSSRCAQHRYRVPRRGRQEAQRRHAGGAGRTWKTRRLADGPRAQDSAASRSRENKDEVLPWSVQEEPTLPTSGALRSSTCHVSLPGAFLGHRGNRKQMRPPAHGCGGRTPRQPPAVPWSSNRLFCERGQKDGHRVACPGIPAQSGRNVGVRLLVAVGTRSRRPEARIPARGPRSPSGLSPSLCGLGLSEAQNKVGAGGPQLTSQCPPGAIHGCVRPGLTRSPPVTDTSLQTDADFPFTRLQPVEDSGARGGDLPSPAPSSPSVSPLLGPGKRLQRATRVPFGRTRSGVHKQVEY